MSNLKVENIELSGNMATVTLSAPISTMVRVPGSINQALQEEEPEPPKENQGQDNQDKQDSLVKKKSRFISAMIIQSCCYPFDLTKEGVLKAALPMFRGLGLYKDHFRSVDNNIGTVKDCYYDDNSMPTGINGWACIDRELDPLSAIRLERGYVNRFSITLSFEWEKSHIMKDNAFLESLGTMVDGELVRLIVVKVTSITEVSLVYFGADPNARSLSSEKINALNINNNALEVSGDKEDKYMEEEIKKLLKAALKRDISTDVQLSQAVKDVLAELEKAKADNLALETQVTALRAAKEFQDTVTKELRTEVLDDAKKVGLGTVKKSHEMLINQADYNALQELRKEFQSELAAMFPLKCAKCGETNVERRSSVEIETPGLKKQNPGFKTIHG